MHSDQIRAQSPIGRDVTVTYQPVYYSSRTADVRGTVIDHSGDRLIIGVHPDMFAIPFDMIGAIR